MTDETPPREIEAESVAPPDKVDETLLECFAKDIAGQAARLDDLAKQLITLGIAIPGIYAAVLKLVSGDKATMDMPGLLLLAFLCWLIALGLSLASLLPVRYEVDRDSLTEIRDYFTSSARRKLVLLSIACFSSFLGICIAVLSIII